MNILKSLLGVSYKNVLFTVRGFHQKNAAIVKYLENVGRSFLNGYHKSLETSSTTELIQFTDSVEDRYSGFTSEGVSMGLTLKDFFYLSNFKNIKSYLKANSKEIYINHVGIGWAFSRLPVNIEKQIQKFDDLLCWLIIDGHGFHQAYFQTRKYVYEMQPPANLKNPFAKKVFYQGVGRALWFIESTNVYNIFSRIQKFPTEYQSDLWAGVGLAAGYAGGCDADEYKQLRHLSSNYREHLLQGVCFGVSARVLAGNLIPSTHLAAETLCNVTPKELFEISEETKKMIPENLSSEGKYAFWKEKIRYYLTKSYEYEKFN